MASKLYKIGDLVTVNDGHSKEVFAKITDIIDKENNSFYEYEVITCEGELNSKVSIKVKPIVYSSNLEFILDYKTGKEKFVNPHVIRLVNINDKVKKLEDDIEILKSRVKFLNINKSREDKLSDLGI